jgi:hypothetical protein
MNAPAESAVAWEPVTPRGVAAFAGARLSRLLLVQFVVAALAAAALAWFLTDRCFPAVRAAIRNLPAAGDIHSGRLDWSGDSPQLLAESRFLAFVVDANHSGQMRSSAEVQIEFGRETVRVLSLPGYVEWAYPSNYVVAFNRTDLQPLWGAWEPAGLAVTLLAGVAGLMGIWAMLATVYFLPVWLVGYMAGRALDWRGSWKLAGAALLPGALLLTAAIVLYNLGALNLVQFCFLFALHLLLGWIYLAISPLFRPRAGPAASRGNPFSSAPDKPAAKHTSSEDNPFASPDS